MSKSLRTQEKCILIKFKRCNKPIFLQARIKSIDFKVKIMLGAYIFGDFLVLFTQPE